MAAGIFLGFVVHFSATLHSGINIEVRLLIFGFFSRGYVLIKEGTPLKKSEILLFDEVGYVFSRQGCIHRGDRCDHGRT